ncbi:hypothetical protein BH09BAC6_BH09BAC6_16240 [soil metagenome]
MKTITLKLYNFKELTKEAKEKALTTYRDLNIDFYWWDNEYEDFIELVSYLGITIDKDSIKFSGFYSQGDGSAFSAKVNFAKLFNAIANQSWKDYAPHQDFPFQLPSIDRRVLALVNNGILPNEPQIIARYRHYDIAVDLGISVINENGRNHNLLFEELDNLETWLRDLAKHLNQYLYKSLENQYEFMISDTAVIETMLANEYLFTTDGRSANHLINLKNNIN